MITDIGYSVPKGSLEFWADRFQQKNIKHGTIQERFGEQYLSFHDPDGLNIDLIIPNKEDTRKQWETDEIKASVATKGFRNITLTLKNIKATAEILTDVLGYMFMGLMPVMEKFSGNPIQACLRRRCDYLFGERKTIPGSGIRNESGSLA